MCLTRLCRLSGSVSVIDGLLQVPDFAQQQFGEGRVDLLTGVCDNKIEYLRKTRDAYYNDDYLEFLVQSVWRLNQPVSIIDYGCGYGYLGLKLLPLLPKGTKYTGIDKGNQLINEARTVFGTLPYETEFIVGDITEARMECKYDVALCHAFLMHMTDPILVLKKMIDSVVDQGRIICFEVKGV